ncbi:unnamed protein product [marine sediment metagenome]|uniref:Uncharacterized protein n=1 Tax=marine sediment metagenome TaxID=412755 RepID=X1PLP7_9ZZZZ
MAKLKAPLLSFGASGALAKAIVFFPWKGVDAVREYVIPANPKTKPQRDQREHMSNAVDEWHDAKYSAIDVTAWNRFAGTLKAIMSGFNAMVRTFIKEAILDNTWTRLKDMYLEDVEDDRFTATIAIPSALGDPTIHWGTSKTHFPDEAVMPTTDGNKGTYTITGLTKNTLYYFYCHYGVSGDTYGRTGIYSQRTAAA